jgi:hypothetical protein
MLVLLSAAAISSGIGGSPAPGETADLTQSTAALLIETSSKFSEVKSKLLLHKDGYQKGHEQGMWVGRIVKDIEPFGQPSEPIHLTKRGSDFFDSIEVQPGGLAYVILKKPLNPLLKVIRITDVPLGQGLKEAQFTWEYVDLPSLVKRYVLRGGRGVGYFRSYDDGWRLDDLNINYLSEPAPQTAEERATEEREDREREALKRKREEEERVEKERLANLLRESKTPTRQVAQFEFHFTTVDSATLIKRSYNFVAKVSDVDIRVEGTERTGDTESKYGYTLWFEDISDMDVGYDPKRQLHWLRIKSIYGRIANWASENEAYITQAYQTVLSARERWRDKYREVVQKNLR